MTAVDIQYSGATLYIAGTLDFASVAQICQAHYPLLDADQPISRIDLSGVHYANSAGVALLVEWLAMAQSAGRSLIFANLPEQMRSIIRVAALESILPLT